MSRSGLCALDAALPLVKIVQELEQDRRDRHREEDAEKASERVARDKRDDDQEGRDADDLLHDERIDEVRLELVHDDIEAGDDGRDRDAAVGVTDHDRHHPREQGPEDGNDLHKRGKDGEEKRVGDTDDKEPEIYEDADNDREQYLPLHPEPYFLLRALPEIDRVFFVGHRHHHAEEIIHAGILEREVEGEYDDKHEREDATEECNDNLQNTAGA